MKKCCPDEVPVIAPTSLRAFIEDGKLFLSVNGKTVVVPLGELSSSLALPTSISIPIVYDNQTVFPTVIPEDKSVTALYIDGIYQDPRYWSVTDKLNLNWISEEPLKTYFSLNIIVQ